MSVTAIQESELKEILDILMDIKNNRFLGNGNGSGNMMNVSSIARASKDLIMSFPFLVMDSIDPRVVSMASKAIESKNVAMLQMLFSATVMTAKAGEGGIDIIKKWHSNIASDLDMSSLDDYIYAMDRLGESGLLEGSHKERIILRNLINESVQAMKEQVKRKPARYPISSFSENSVLSYAVYEGKWDTKPTVISVQERKVHPDGSVTFSADEITKAKKSINGQQKSKGANPTDSLKNTEFFSKQLLDSDVKKINELVPSLMVVRFNVVNDNGDFQVEQQFVAGVKSRVIPIDSYDLFDRIVSKNKDKNGLVQFIRATTKEISFVKDYLLAIDQAKGDALKASRSRTTRLFKNLEKRSTKSVWNRLSGKNNDAACITSIMISQEGVDYLKKEHNVDLNNPKVAAKIMDAYNLLCLVIVDESIEVMKFLYDADSQYEQLAFSSLERQGNDGSYKKVINLLSKMNR